MTHKKKEYKEPTLDIIRLRKLCLLEGTSDPFDPADEPGTQARRYDFDE